MEIADAGSPLAQRRHQTLKQGELQSGLFRRINVIIYMTNYQNMNLNRGIRFTLISNKLWQIKASYLFPDLLKFPKDPQCQPTGCRTPEYLTAIDQRSLPQHFSIKY